MAAEERNVTFTLADLIDRVSIDQIKETLFPEPRRAAITEDLTDVTADIDDILENRPQALDGRMVRLIMLMAQCNLHVWLNKEKMQDQPDEYVALLARAQELNGLRNHARNLIMDESGEMTPSARRATFLDDSGTAWYAPIIRDL